MQLSLRRRTPKRFDSRVFPQYGRLTRAERAFLRTCCYYPPRPHRERTLEQVGQTERYAAVYERAFGPQLWSWIEGKDVLDLGCGEGGHVLALAARGARQAVGLDTLPAFFNAEQEARRRGYQNVSFIGAAAETLPDASFDVVISHDSFEHFEDAAAVLAQMVRLTRPGGRVLIKFGPPWRNPWGRHMGGTVRRDRPWVHLVVPERTVMHCHSVYHNDPVMSDRYQQLPGGMNKMTVNRFRALLRRQPGIAIEQFHVLPLFGRAWLTAVPVLDEFFASGVRAVCVRE